MPSGQTEQDVILLTTPTNLHSLRISLVAIVGREPRASAIKKAEKNPFPSQDAVAAPGVTPKLHLWETMRWLLLVSRLNPTGPSANLWPLHLLVPLQATLLPLLVQTSVSPPASPFPARGVMQASEWTHAWKGTNHSLGLIKLPQPPDTYRCVV